jgi:CubicO group peptidase (beta-lactamase class C family)
MASRKTPILRLIVFGLLAMLAWIAMLLTAATLTEDEIRPADTSSASFVLAVRDFARSHRGNLVMLRIDDGKISSRVTHSIGTPVDENSLFQVASVSKWVTAWGVMALVERGKLDLDAPVSKYLTRWQLPPTEYDNDAVTVRRLLSHTAGLTDGLGYCGFASENKLQSLEQSLTTAADACPFVNGVAHVGGTAGEWRYSGAGFTMLQLVIEEVSGQPFADYMATAVLKPLGMDGSTFQPDKAATQRLAQFFDADGSAAPHLRYTAKAAGSLYTSAADLARFAQAHWPGPQGEAVGRGVVSPATLRAMLAPQAKVIGRDHWGLGMRLYAPRTGGGHIVGHDGGNVPAINTTIRLDATARDAIIALSTGGTSAASKLGTGWLYQRTATADLPDRQFDPIVLYGHAVRMQVWIVAGLVVIVLAAAVLAVRQRRR